MGYSDSVYTVYSSTLNPPLCDRLSPRGYTLDPGAEDVTLTESLSAKPARFCASDSRTTAFSRYGDGRGLVGIGWGEERGLLGGLFCMPCKVSLIK